MDSIHVIEAIGIRELDPFIRSIVSIENIYLIMNGADRFRALIKREWPSCGIHFLFSTTNSVVTKLDYINVNVRRSLK